MWHWLDCSYRTNFNECCFVLCFTAYARIDTKNEHSISLLLRRWHRPARMSSLRT